MILYNNSRLEMFNEKKCTVGSLRLNNRPLDSFTYLNDVFQTLFDGQIKNHLTTFDRRIE